MAKIKLDRLMGRFHVDKSQEHWDDTVRGLGVRINSDGTSVYISKYFCRKRQYKKTIGSCAMITLDQARRLVMRMKVLAKAGDDPADLINSFISDHKIVKNGSVTFERFAKVYMERHAIPHKKSWLKDQQRIDYYLLPIWANKHLTEITRADVSDLHRRIGKKAPYAANRLKELISTMFRNAIIWGYLPDNHPSVVLGVREFREKPRKEFIEPEQMPAVKAALASIPNICHREGILFLLYTGLRSSEARLLTWDQVNFNQQFLEIQDTKNGSDHMLPLSSHCIELLKRMQLKKRLGNPYVFPGTLPGRPISSFGKAWRKVRSVAGLPNIRLHDLRRTAGSYVIADTHSIPLVGQILNQTNEHVTKIYSHYDKRAVRIAINKLGDTIHSLLESA